MKHYLEFSDDKSNKFWKINQNGTSVTITYGKIGTNGRTETKEYESEEKAKLDVEKQLKAKFKKGYISVVENDEAPYKIKKWHTDEFWEPYYYHSEVFEEMRNGKIKGNNIEKLNGVELYVKDDGNAYLNFLYESEESYQNALTLMAWNIDDDYLEEHSGYTLNVRFDEEPSFIENIDFPQTQTNAFFAKAVQYESVRDLMRDYASDNIGTYTRYNDLEDEDTTIVGAFAICALALADKQYLDLAVLYGKLADGEHEQIQLELAYAIEKVWGVNEETAPAIFQLITSYDHEDLEVSSEFYKNSKIVEALTKHIKNTSERHTAYKPVRFLKSMFATHDATHAMELLKEQHDNAQDEKSKIAYAEFYNAIIEINGLSRYKAFDLEQIKIDYSSNKEVIEARYKELYDIIFDALQEVLWSAAEDFEQDMEEITICADFPQEKFIFVKGSDFDDDNVFYSYELGAKMAEFEKTAKLAEKEGIINFDEAIIDLLKEIIEGNTMAFNGMNVSIYGAIAPDAETDLS